MSRLCSETFVTALAILIFNFKLLTMFFRSKLLALLLLAPMCGLVRSAANNEGHSETTPYSRNDTLLSEGDEGRTISTTSNYSEVSSLAGFESVTEDGLTVPNRDTVTGVNGISTIHDNNSMFDNSTYSTHSGTTASIDARYENTTRSAELVTHKGTAMVTDYATLVGNCSNASNDSSTDNCEFVDSLNGTFRCSGYQTISKKQYTTIKTIGNRMFAPVISVVGLFGNTLGIAVLIYQKLKHTFHICLLCLMVIDSVFLLSNLLMSITSIIELVDSILANYLTVHVGHYLTAIRSMSFGAGAHMVTVMACERFVIIMFPFWIKRVNLKKYGVVLISVVLILNLSLLVTRIIQEKPESYFDTEINATMYRLVTTDFRESNLDFLRIVLLVVFVFLRFVPLLITVFFNVFILMQISKQHMKRVVLFASSTSIQEQREQMKRTFAMIAYSTLTIFALSTSLTTTVLRQFWPDTFGFNGCQPYVTQFFYEIGYMLRALNASLDFVIYLFLSKVYRQTMWKLLGKFDCRKKLSPTGSTSLNISLATNNSSTATASSQVFASADKVRYDPALTGDLDRADSEKESPVGLDGVKLESAHM